MATEFLAYTASCNQIFMGIRLLFKSGPLCTVQFCDASLIVLRVVVETIMISLVRHHFCLAAGNATQDLGLVHHSQVYDC